MRYCPPPGDLGATMMDSGVASPAWASAAPCGVCCSAGGRVALLLFMLLLAAAILVGNLVALAVLLGTKALRTPQGYLKASLAAADLAVGAVVVPLSVYAEARLLAAGPAPEWTRSDSRAVTFHPCSVVGPVFAGCTLVSISTIFLMTVERSVAVLRPLHRGAVVTRGRTAALIALSWGGSFLLAVAPLLTGGEIALEYNACSRMCNYALGGGAGGLSRPAWNILLLFPAFDFTLLGGTVVVNVVSLSSIRRHSRRRKHLAGADGRAASKPSSSDIKAARTIGALTVAFTASFTPIAVFVVGNVLGNRWCGFSFAAFWVLTSNSCWNVVIYSVRDRRFRTRACQIFTPFRRKNASETQKMRD